MNLSQGISGNLHRKLLLVLQEQAIIKWPSFAVGVTVLQTLATSKHRRYSSTITHLWKWHSWTIPSSPCSPRNSSPPRKHHHLHHLLVSCCLLYLFPDNSIFHPPTHPRKIINKSPCFSLSLQNLPPPVLHWAMTTTFNDLPTRPLVVAALLSPGIKCPSWNESSPRRTTSRSHVAWNWLPS